MRVWPRTSTGPGGVGAVDPRAEALADLLDDPQEGLGKVVGVDVDGRRRAHGRGLYYSRRHEPCQSGPEPCQPGARALSGGRDVRLPRERFDYSPSWTADPGSCPAGARIAVWTIVNVEEWDIEKAMARQYLTAPQGVATVPDVPNWAWHDYGMRVGFWRLLDALAKRARSARPPRSMPTSCQSYEPVARAMLDAGWEFMGHGVDAGRDAPPARPARGDPRVGRAHARSSPARRPRAGSGRASPRRGRRSTSWPRRASSTSPTGSTTTSPTRSAPRRARSSRCPTRSSSTTSR